MRSAHPGSIEKLAPDVQCPERGFVGTPQGRWRSGITGAIEDRRMFFFYFNKLGWVGSILVSLALTLVLILAIYLFNG
jgi:hypothetical protein